MNKAIALKSYVERVRLARQAAVDGYGWEDLVDRYDLKEDVARYLVWGVAAHQRAMRAEK
jgi:hypothetical protein